MTKIKPFKAVIYNQDKIKDVSNVVCPPYDIISQGAQEHYHERSPYNLIHILLGRDNPGEDKYKRAGNYFRDWLKNKIFIPDQGPNIYFYSQEYNIKGEKKTRLGFIALLHLGDNNASVFGHEHTRLEPKEDRLRLIKAVRANLSPIFVLFSDQKRIIQRTYQEYLQGEKPFIEIKDEDKILHKLWRIDSPDILSDIEKRMSGVNIFIADGHHRYEVACAYRQEMRDKLGSITGEEDFNYILAYFTNVESRGLSILPIHRLVKLDSSFSMNNFAQGLKAYFDLDEVKDKTRFFFLLEKAGSSEHVLGMYKAKRYWLMRLKNVKILDKMINDKPLQYRSLDVAILNYIVLKKILELDFEDKDRITFSPINGELIERVDNDNSYIAFFLNPVKIQQIMSVALSQEKMPAKSTYFYPKVLSGLVINKHED